MDQNDLRDNAMKLSTELCPTIGEFVVNFEKVNQAIRMGIYEILEIQGLKDARIIDIFIGDLTFFPLQSIFRALISQTQKLNQTESKMVDNIFNRIVKLAEERNKIIHSAWFIDYKDHEAINSGMLFAYKPGHNKQGAKPPSFLYPIADIKKGAQNAIELADIVYQLGHCIYICADIELYFEFDKDQNVNLINHKINYKLERK